MTELTDNIYLKPQREIIKAIPIPMADGSFMDTPNCDKTLLCNFIAAIRYIYSNKRTGYVDNEVESWLSNDKNDWFGSTAFDESTCIKFLNSFRDNFTEYKDLECIRDLRFQRINDTDAYYDYINEENDLTENLFDLNEYFDFLMNKDGSLKPIEELDERIVNTFSRAACSLQSAILTNYNKQKKSQIDGAKKEVPPAV